MTTEEAKKLPCMHYTGRGNCRASLCVSWNKEDKHCGKENKESQEDEGSQEDREQYCLVGVDGNAYAVMAYVIGALRKEGKTEKECEAFKAKAMSGSYYDLLACSMCMLDILNNATKTN